MISHLLALALLAFFGSVLKDIFADVLRRR